MSGKPWRVAAANPKQPADGVTTMAEEQKGAKRQRLKGAMIGGSDLVPQIVRDLTVPVKLRGINDFSKHLDAFPVQWERVHISPNYFRQNWRWNFRKYQIVCNLVTDGDRNPKTLKVAQRMAEKIALPMINPPGHIPLTARDRLPSVIGDIPGVIMPRTIRLKNVTAKNLDNRIANEAVDWPLLVRKPGSHGGYFVGLFARPQEFAEKLGEERKDYLLTEFVDFASDDGLYRKYRFFFIGDRIVLRHLIAATSWNVHARDRQGLMMERPELRQEEEAALRAQLEAFPPRTTEILEEIRARIGLDYFGIDCHVKPEGQVLVFESNATMNYLPYSEAPEYSYVSETLSAVTQEAVGRLLESKLGRPLLREDMPSPERAGAAEAQTG